MFGPDEVITSFETCDPVDWGLVPRATAHIFNGLASAAAGSAYEVMCSYLEVYNDHLNDVLGGGQNLSIKEAKKGVMVEGLQYVPVATSKEVMGQLHIGNGSRIIAPMKMNARSSRGHGVFTMYIKEFTAGGERNGKLNLVDLAGAKL